MKKTGIALIVVAVVGLVASFVGCGGDQEQPPQQQPEQTEQQEREQMPGVQPPAESDEKEGGKQPIKPPGR